MFANVVQDVFVMVLTSDFSFKRVRVKSFKGNRGNIKYFGVEYL